jgi:uroporphyrinogen decarboxylase
LELFQAPTQLDVASGRFVRALGGEPSAVPPIWLMRQAGRYHSHYRALRERHSFEALCREPSLAAEVALGPIADFDFDAAILFSDLLFPLEALGMRLSYADGPPALDGPLDTLRIDRFRAHDDALTRLRFQAQALAATRARLDPSKGLVGFVGGPWTLFVYAMEGSHAGAMKVAKSSWQLYQTFTARMTPLIDALIGAQLEAGADVVMVLDTAAGELPPAFFAREVAPDLVRLAHAHPRRVGYYAKASHPALYGEGFVTAPWAGMGVDSRWPLAATLAARPWPGFVQGNFDPAWLFLPERHLPAALDEFLAPVVALAPVARQGWICGLGHGVLPGTPEAAVRTFVSRVRQVLA